MRKRILMIANPGEETADNYCSGVYDDIRNYQQFFMSKCGGEWYSEEILCLDKPEVKTVRDEIQKMRNMDYVIVVFSGHGYSQNDTTYLECRPGKGTEDDLSEYELQIRGIRELIILDCCRKAWYPANESTLVHGGYIQKEFSLEKSTRAVYEATLMDCPPSIEKLYACSLGECSEDQEHLGGAYSYTLLKSAREQHKKLSQGTHFTVPAIHNYAVDKMKNRFPNQHPRMNKPKSGPYFPLAIKA